VASLTGGCLRSMVQLALLRDFYRPALFFSGQARAAAVGWGLLLTVVLLAGFLAPAAVALANLIPGILARYVPPVRWLAGRRSCLLWPFATSQLHLYGPGTIPPGDFNWNIVNLVEGG
jgi:hypothetical protein